MGGGYELANGSLMSEKAVEGVVPSKPVRGAGDLLLPLLLGPCELGLHPLPDSGLGNRAAESDDRPHGIRRPRLPHRLGPHGLGRQQLLLPIIFPIIFLLTLRSPIDN